MPSWCVIRGCQAKQDGVAVSHHRLPKDHETGLQWLRLAGRQDIIDKGHDYWVKKVVCSAHFEDHCFLNPARTKLIRHRPVFPSINMGTATEQEEANAEQQEEEEADEDYGAAGLEPDVDISEMLLEPQVDLHTAEEDDEGDGWSVEPIVYDNEETEGRRDPNRPSHMDDDEYQRKIQETLDYIQSRKNEKGVRGRKKKRRSTSDADSTNSSGTSTRHKTVADIIKRKKT